MRYVVLLGAPGVGKTTIMDGVLATVPDKGKWISPEDLEVEAARFILSSEEGGVYNAMKSMALKWFPVQKIRSKIARMILAGEYHNTHWSEKDYKSLNCLLDSISGQSCPPDIKLMRFKWLLEKANFLAYVEWLKGQGDERVVLFDESIFQVICSLGPWDKNELEKVREYVRVVGDPCLTIHLETSLKNTMNRLGSRAGNKINKAHIKMSPEQVKDDIGKWIVSCKQLTEILGEEGFDVVNVDASLPIDQVVDEIHSYLVMRCVDETTMSNENKLSIL